MHCGSLTVGKELARGLKRNGACYTTACLSTYMGMIPRWNMLRPLLVSKHKYHVVLPKLGLPMGANTLLFSRPRPSTGDYGEVLEADCRFVGSGSECGGGILQNNAYKSIREFCMPGWGVHAAYKLCGA